VQSGEIDPLRKSPTTKAITRTRNRALSARLRICCNHRLLTSPGQYGRTRWRSIKYSVGLDFRIMLDGETRQMPEEPR
jgi:hypothetical protein